jgi:hypothetical protein
VRSALTGEPRSPVPQRAGSQLLRGNGLARSEARVTALQARPGLSTQWMDAPRAEIRSRGVARSC